MSSTEMQQRYVQCVQRGHAWFEPEYPASTRELHSQAQVSYHLPHQDTRHERYLLSNVGCVVLCCDGQVGTQIADTLTVDTECTPNACSVGVCAHPA